MKKLCKRFFFLGRVNRDEKKGTKKEIRLNERTLNDTIKSGGGGGE